MFIGFTGSLGSGKTLSMTFWGKYFSRKLNIPCYSNYKTNFAENITDWKQLMAVQNGVVLLDELHILMDSRTSGISKNRFGGGNKQTYRTHFMLQTRKKNMLVMFTTQHISQVDLRIRNICDYVILCQKKGLSIKNTVVNWADMNIGKTLVLNNVNRIYNWYDTYELVHDI